LEAATMRIIAVFAAIALGLTVAHGPVDAAGTGSANKPPAPGADQSLYKGARAIEAGDYQLAVKYLKKAVRLNPRNADGFNFLGYSYRKLGKFDPAFENYEKALALPPKCLPEWLGSPEASKRLHLSPRPLFLSPPTDNCRPFSTLPGKKFGKLSSNPIAAYLESVGFENIVFPMSAFRPKAEVNRMVLRLPRLAKRRHSSVAR